ncbi:MAG: hypothetical protein C0446_14290 [Chitinophaga sp.]|nr:hypothetical protein [Chitinophaga sp.]
MDAFNSAPFLDGRSLSGEYITEPFAVFEINEDKKSVFDSQDRLSQRIKSGDINSIEAIKDFAYLQSMAARGNTYALNFFFGIFQDGNLFGQTLPGFQAQPERAEFFDALTEISIAWKAAQTKESKTAILGRINSIIKQSKLFDYMQHIKLDDPEKFNEVICEIIEILVVKFGKNKKELADKFGISRSSIYRTLKQQTLGKKATTPTAIFNVFRSHATNLQTLLGLSKEQYDRFIYELDIKFDPSQSRSPVEASGMRHRKLITAFPSE